MLKKYEEKRDFSVTSEPPPGAESGRSGPLAFVVQKHAATRLHYDFRIEFDGALKSWSVPKGPSLDPGQKRLAVLVEDHPLEYRSFEGVIPKGEYGAGQVIVWDQGAYSPDEGGRLSWDDRAEAEGRMREGFEQGKLSFFLRGQKLKGSWTLVRMQRSQKDWLLIKHRDSYASPERDILKEDLSVISGIGIDDLKAGKSPALGVRAEVTPAEMPGARRAPMPDSVSPMLATLAAEPFDDPGWYFEPKLDGYRVVAFIRDGKATLRSRGGLDVTNNYALLGPELVQQPAAEIMLDGEIIALDEKGKQCFQCLQNYLQSVQKTARGRIAPAIPLVYYVFDVLYLDGYDLLKAPLEQRKRLLSSALRISQHVRLVDYFEGEGKALFRAAIENGLEGVVAKRKDSMYEAGRRSRNWLKVKTALSDDFVIGGYTLGRGARSGAFGALLLGYFEDSGRLTYAGHVGSGFDQRGLAEIRQSLQALKVADCPFRETPPENAPATWVRPELVAEVKYAEVTGDGYLRAPVFLRLRLDKPASEVRHPAVMSSPVSPVADSAAPAHEPEQEILARLAAPGENATIEVSGHRLSLTKLDKELWPAAGDRRAVTKRDLIGYLARVSPYLLPHLHNRPLTFSRYPDGIQGEHFFQKHWATPLPNFVETVMLSSKSKGRKQQYVMCNNLPTLLWLGQVANLEVHTWFSRIVAAPDLDVNKGPDQALELPDFIIFDIDPYIYSGKEAIGAEPELNREAFARASQVALWLKAALDSLSLPAFVKTSGATGFHIHVPVKRSLDYRATRSAARTIGQFVQKQHPGDITLDWAIDRRKGKVFIDYNQNIKGKTLASAYSPRPTPQATVSTPLRWEEVGQVYPTDFTVFTLPERLKQTGDLWRNMLDVRSDLQGLLRIGRQTSSRPTPDATDAVEY
ncbi:MAG: DNA ligase D [Dehalococcoidia bacterium]|nr:DNA ligase D [Dehalococcoidia bacterium]